MKRNTLKLLLACAALSVTLAAQATTYNLGDLITSGGSFQVGDKVFANFDWTPSAAFGGTLVPASSVQIVTLDNNPSLYGIRIVAGLSVAGTGFSDAALSYSVTTTGNWLISDLHQSIVGGGGAAAGGFWSVSSSEVGRATPGGPALVTSTVGTSIFGPVDLDDPPAEIGDILVLATPVRTLWIDKDINASAVNGFSQISIIDQRFSQVPTRVPDGASTVSLLGLVMLGVEGLRRKLGRK